MKKFLTSLIKIVCCLRRVSNTHRPVKKEKIPEWLFENLCGGEVVIVKGAKNPKTGEYVKGYEDFITRAARAKGFPGIWIQFQSRVTTDYFHEGNLFIAMTNEAEALAGFGLRRGVFLRIYGIVPKSFDQVKHLPKPDAQGVISVVDFSAEPGLVGGLKYMGVDSLELAFIYKTLSLLSK